MTPDKTYIKINGVGYSTSAILNLSIQNADDLWAETVSFLVEWLNPEATIRQQSSGSTAAPKQMKLPKAAMIESAKMTGSFFGFHDRMNVLLCLSPKYIAGKMMIIRALVWKMNLIIAKTTSNPVAQIDQPIDFCAMVPLQLSKILDETPLKLKLLNTVIIGGSALSPQLEQQLQEVKTSFYHTYGMTETMSHIALRKMNGEHKSAWFSPLKNIELSADARGCLIIDAKSLGINKLLTNDLVSIARDQKFKLLGRIDDVIISAGKKIHPLLVEQKLGRHFKNQMLIVGIPHEKAGETTLLAIEGNTTIPTLYELWKTLSALLTAEEMPRRIHFIDQIPMLESGKPNRKLLRKMLIGELL
ncbi:MAG: AMP-binding protein [Bacteroidetes bacterium]|jgi:O-succinylbenzoic acid--CoA ligase|nr:AMP-binding protein [Bacteroidota bacterium]